MNNLRNEYKYMIDSAQMQHLKITAQGLLDRDAHCDESGSYVVRSVYFDDVSDNFLYEKIEGITPRYKYRIRYYNQETSLIKLEKKLKLGNKTLKTACSISQEECVSLIEKGRLDIISDMDDVKQMLINDFNHLNLVPKVIVTYKRYPFVCKIGNVRLTFDEEISSAADINRFLSHDYVQRPILEYGISIMEIKWDEFIPSHILIGLGLKNAVWTEYSKYAMCRLFHL